MRACLRLHAVRLVFFGAGTLGLKGKPTGNPKPAWGFQILKRRAAHFIAIWLANSAHGFQASLPLAPGPGTRSSTQEPWFPFRDFLTLRAKKKCFPWLTGKRSWNVKEIPTFDTAARAIRPNSTSTLISHVKTDKMVTTMFEGPCPPQTHTHHGACACPLLTFQSAKRRGPTCRREQSQAWSNLPRSPALFESAQRPGRRHLSARNPLTGRYGRFI